MTYVSKTLNTSINSITFSIKDNPKLFDTNVSLACTTNKKGFKDENDYINLNINEAINLFEDVLIELKNFKLQQNSRLT